MYVCLCAGVTESQVRVAIQRGDASVEQLKSRLGVAANCGGCLEHTLTMLAEARDAAVEAHSGVQTPEVPAFLTPSYARELFYSAA